MGGFAAVSVTLSGCRHIPGAYIKANREGI